MEIPNLVTAAYELSKLKCSVMELNFKKKCFNKFLLNQAVPMDPNFHRMEYENQTTKTPDRKHPALI